MRRLPIFFLIDVSESMVGEPIQQVEEGLATIIQALKKDPVSMDTVWVSIIVFAGQPRTLIPLQEIINFYPPKFPVGSGTSLSNGLGHLMYELRKNIIKTTVEQKGDWKPIVFLFTDGVPTDDTKGAISEWKRNWMRTANMIAVSFGDGADSQILGELTENVLIFKNTNSDSYKQFFNWVTDSIKTNSKNIENNVSELDFAKIDGNVISKIDLCKDNNLPKQFMDTNYVVLAAKCQNTKRPYLMKYKKNISRNEIEGLNMNVLSYRLVGAYQVDNTYFDLSYESVSNNKINTNELIGAPTCPCCGNQYAFAICGCGNLHCIDDRKVNTCPWCGTQSSYSFGEKGFNVNRTQG